MVDFRNRLRGAEGAARRAVGRLKTWFEPPLDTDARPLEIREAIIDHVEARAEPAAAGRRVLPHNHATATILAATPEDRAALEPAVADLDEAIRTRLAEVRCPVPNGFELEVTFIKRPKPGWREGQRFAVDYDSRPVTRGAASREPALPVPRVAIIRGKTAEKRYAFTEPHVRIGRTASPTDHMGRPRHKHIVFVEGDDEHSATVGRAHASIQ